MLTAISRYGARWVPDADGIVEACRSRGQLVNGPAIGAFERALEERLGGGHAVTTSYGRMAFYYILKALDLPPGAEIVFPALTFWVVPAMARAAGLRPVFADVDPVTFNLDPEALERAITPATRAVVPTHVYGRPCDMDEVLAVARRHHLAVIEDCAHALGASYHGQPVGTLGDAALLSFQVLKPLNTFGGGAAYTRHEGLGRRIAEIARAEPWPPEARVRRRIRMARLERALMRPEVFSTTVFPVLWAASFFRARPDVYLWEKVRPLWPLPEGYAERYSNVQAAIGVAALDRLDDWTARTRAHARYLTAALSHLDGVTVPADPDDRVHVYYQYCVYPGDRDGVVRRCLRRGLDVEYHHMDVCPDLPLFAASRMEAPGARRTADALQLPVHPGLRPEDLLRVARRFASAAAAPDFPHAAAAGSHG
jgi:perosamine synthetase